MENEDIVKDIAKDSKQYKVPQGAAALPFLLSLVIVGCEPETKQLFIPMSVIKSAFEDYDILNKAVEIKWIEEVKAEKDGDKGSDSGYLIRVMDITPEDANKDKIIKANASIVLPKAKAKANKLIRV